MTADLISWRHTWPERGPDFLAVVYGGQFARIHKTHPDHTHGYEWVWSLTYQAATGLTKQGRSKTKEEAADAVRRGMDEALIWHAERGQPLLLRLDGESDTPHLDWMRPPVRIVVGRDVPWPEGGAQ